MAIDASGREVTTMHVTTRGSMQINARHIRLAGLALALLLAGVIIAGLSVSRWGKSENETLPLPVVNDTTTLALDRDGADLFTAQQGQSLEMTGSALDLNAVYLHSLATRGLQFDTTTLRLDRDGADVFPSPAPVAPDTTKLILDRNGADYGDVPGQLGFTDLTDDGTATSNWLHLPGHAGFSHP